MKKFLLLFLGIACLANAQAQIPNGNFETWIVQAGAPPYEEAEGFISTNTLSFFFAGSQITNVTKVTGTTAGTYAAKMTSLKNTNDTIEAIMLTATLDQLTAGNFFGGFPYSNTPAFMKGQFKFDPKGEDTATVIMVFTKWDTVSNTSSIVGFGEVDFTEAQLNFTDFYMELQFDDVPDTAGIIMASTGVMIGLEGDYTDGTSLTVDEFVFINAFADFTYDPSAPEENETIIFQNLSQGMYDSLKWDFDFNNATSTEDNPQFTYTTAGTYTVTLSLYSGSDTVVATQDVTVSPAAGISSENIGNTRVYPNPANNQITIAYDLNHAGNTNLRIFDLTGKEMLSSTGFSQAGKQQQQLNIAALASGIYYYEFRSGEEVVRNKFVIAR